MRHADDIASRQRLAVVGVAKNCGKTTTLDHLLRRRQKLDLAAPGLLSIGVDGESEDVLLGTEKPAIYARKNQWVVTAERAIERSTARFEYVQSLGLVTPMGEVFVCRVIDEGTVMLAGLRHRREMAQAVEVLADLGPGPVWVDGAYGRVAGAHRSVTDAVVVSTGAVVGSTVDEIVTRTKDLVSRLSLPTIDNDHERLAMRRAVDEGQVMLVDGQDNVVRCGAGSAVTGLDAVGAIWRPTTQAIAIPGLVSDRVAEELLSFDSAARLLICDGTVLHMEARLWKRLRSQWQVQALDPIEVVAISYNPTSVVGGSVDENQLRRRLVDGHRALTVFNPLQ